jgi:hypothetical protein
MGLAVVLESPAASSPGVELSLLGGLLAFLDSGAPVAGAVVVGSRTARVAITIRALERKGKTEFLMELQDDSIPQPPAQGKPREG